MHSGVCLLNYICMCIKWKLVKLTLKISMFSIEYLQKHLSCDSKFTNLTRIKIYYAVVGLYNSAVFSTNSWLLLIYVADLRDINDQLKDSVHALTKLTQGVKTVTAKFQSAPKEIAEESRQKTTLVQPSYWGGGAYWCSESLFSFKIVCFYSL